MKEIIRSPAGKIWIAAMAFLLFGSVTILVYYIHSDRKNELAQVDKDILYDASFAASNLDAILRIGSLNLSHIVFGEGTVQKKIQSIAFELPEASNIYAVDDTGSVLWSAYKRLDHGYSIDPAIISRMRAGAVVDCRIVDMPQEGGKVLALLHRIDTDGKSPFYAVILLSGYTLQRGVSMLLSRSYAGMHVSDPHGGSLTLIESATSMQEQLLDASVSLANFPLAVTVTAYRYGVLETWRTRTIVLCVVAGGLAVTIGILFLLGYKLYKRRLTEEQLHRDIETRDSLFKEVNHRVKNNLIIVQTMIMLGIDSIEKHPERAAATLNSSVDRLRAMALLHELLYSRPKDAGDNFGSYLGALTEALIEAFDLGTRIRLEERHDDGLRCTMDSLVPLALVINELLTNAFKYAFPGDRAGTIHVEATRAEDTAMVIDVWDDGVGIDNTKKSEGGIGTMLIEALTSQLGATIERTRRDEPGTGWRLTVPPEPD